MGTAHSASNQRRKVEEARRVVQQPLADAAWRHWVRTQCGSSTRWRGGDEVAISSSSRFMRLA